MANSQASEEFCRRIDQLFDILNSSSASACGNKAAITRDNWKSIKSTLEESAVFLQQLKSKKGKFIKDGRRKTFIIGFSIAIKSVIELSEEMLFGDGEPKLKCFFTRLIQQVVTSKQKKPIIDGYKAYYLSKNIGLLRVLFLAGSVSDVEAQTTQRLSS